MDNFLLGIQWREKRIINAAIDAGPRFFMPLVIAKMVFVKMTYTGMLYSMALGN